MSPAATIAPTALREWVAAVARHTRPERVHWCDGSVEEWESLTRSKDGSGSFVAIDAKAHPGGFLQRPDPGCGDRTFICAEHPSDAGPTNRWMSRSDAEDRVWTLFGGSMRGRTMYVVPYLLGPKASSLSRVGVQLTDSPYLVLNLRIMTRMGAVALEHLAQGDRFVRGVHSLGDLKPERSITVHNPESGEIWSYGRGGDTLLSGKAHALRMASVQARKEGWLAERMLLVGLTSPKGAKRYIAAAFPTQCGKTSLATLVPTLPGWTVDTVGDDACWMRPGSDGRLWAVNPKNGTFGGAFGATRCPAPIAQCPSARGSFDLASGVPISAIIFGGRRASLVPLVYEALRWRHGVYIGATLASEAVDDASRAARSDPMAMLDFCAYNMGDYFAHWLEIGERLTRPPKVFHVNWFRTGDDGTLLWPGFGDNIRVLKWILERIDDRGGTRKSALGLVPHEDSIELHGLNSSRERIRELLAIDPGAWLQEAGRTLEFLGSFGTRLPSALLTEHRALVERLQARFTR